MKKTPLPHAVSQSPRNCIDWRGLNVHRRTVSNRATKRRVPITSPTLQAQLAMNRAAPHPVYTKPYRAAPTLADGQRILIERMWPRGLPEQNVDLWAKEVAPSRSLQSWYGFKPDRWEEFRTRYEAELTENAVGLHLLRNVWEEGPITLIFATRDEVQNAATIVQQFLEREG